MIHIRTQQVIIQQPPARIIRPGIAMDNQDFLKGFHDALRAPVLVEEPMSDEEIVDIIQSIAKGAEDEQAELYYSVGNLVGLIIASCQ